MSDFKFIKYLNNSRNKKNFNYTSLHKPKGAFFIAPNQTDVFLKLYHDYIYKKKQKPYITEVHDKYTPILIDLDFRFEISSKTISRNYNLEFIKKFIMIYLKYIDKYLIQCNPEYKKIFVTEIPEPIILKEKKIIKDGIHIIMPYIITDYNLLLQIRKDIINDNEYIKLLKTINIINSPENVFDKAVIQKK